MSVCLILAAAAAALCVASAGAQSGTGSALIVNSCSSDVSQHFSVNDGDIGVVTTDVTRNNCVSNAGAGGALTLQLCQTNDQQEIGYNLTANSTAPVTWKSSGLCWDVAPSKSGPPAVVLTACSSSSPSFAYNGSTKQINVLPPPGASWAAATAQCVDLTAAPPPLLSMVYGDHMVLQQGAPFNVKGSADPGTLVTVSLAAAQHEVTADGSGLWVATFASMPPGGPYTLQVSTHTGRNATARDVYVGQVIFCSGQSNLSGGNTPVKYVFNASQEIADAALFPMVRIFSAGCSGEGSDVPLTNLPYPPKIPWSVASPDTVRGFSATCWLTGKPIAEYLANGTALGLIESAWGGTSIQPWLSAAAIDACGAPPPPSYPGGWPKNASSLFNQQVLPFAGMPVSGFVWYQGESNALAGQAAYYDCALPELITSWRAQFGSPDAWFGAVQLAPWTVSDASDNEVVAELRASQLKARALPGVTVATAVDLGDVYAPIGSIHPRNKQPLGSRLGAGYLLHAYGVGRASLSMGPIEASSVAGGGPAGVLSATVSFEPGSIGGGLLVLLPPTSTGPRTNSSECPPGVPTNNCGGFQLQTANGSWVPANASLVGNGSQLLLVADPPTPATAGLNATSSGWSIWPITLLYNADGVPVFPWRSGVAATA